MSANNEISEYDRFMSLMSASVYIGMLLILTTLMSSNSANETFELAFFFFYVGFLYLSFSYLISLKQQRSGSDLSEISAGLFTNMISGYVLAILAPIYLFMVRANTIRGIELLDILSYEFHVLLLFILAFFAIIYSLFLFGDILRNRIIIIFYLLVEAVIVVGLFLIMVHFSYNSVPW